MKAKKLPKEFRESKKEFEQYENSIGGVLYDLKTLADCTIEDDKNKVIIAKTLLRLPHKVREKVLDEAVFIVMAVQGLVYKAHFPIALKKEDFKQVGECYFSSVEPILIFLNFSKKMKISEKMDTIAHEIAHFILGHVSDSSSKKARKRNAEKEADDLAEKWGFKQSYKSYEA